MGSRETSPVYFLQLMVRYGLVWGRIKPGDDHQLGHFLEKDMPGVVIIRQDLSPLKYLVVLGLMKLGAPAVVPSTFPFPYGNRVVADSDEHILQRITGFENLRIRKYGDETLSLPAYANTAYVKQEFSAAAGLGVTDASFLCMWPADYLASHTFRTAGTGEGREIGIRIDVREEKFTIDISALMERAAYRALNYVDGWRARDGISGFVLECADNAPYDTGKAKEALRAGIRLQFPGLRDFEIEIIRDPELLAELAPIVRRFKQERHQLIESMTEENTELFAVCTECRPFSLVHTCIITPDRTPMCASRSYFSVKASAYFGSDQHPYQRRSEQGVPLRSLFPRGRILDLARGEYEGANEVYRDLTRGALTRVRLHSLDEVPHTSCGCFQNLAFRIKGHGGIGIMKRGSAVVTPDARTWEMLANYAGGKQSDGIMGVSNQYIASSEFLRGDGGLRSLVWTDSESWNRINDLFSPGQRVATEKDVSTVAELKAFLHGSRE
jgi:acetyl-CoA decarbonylase/synthase complex subunit beta